MVQIALPKPQDATVAVDVDFLGKRLRLFIHTMHTGEAGGFAGQTMSGSGKPCMLCTCLDRVIARHPPSSRVACDSARSPEQDAASDGFACMIVTSMLTFSNPGCRCAWLAADIDSYNCVLTLCSERT